MASESSSPVPTLSSRRTICPIILFVLSVVQALPRTAAVATALGNFHENVLFRILVPVFFQHAL